MIVRLADERDIPFLVSVVSKMISELVCPEYINEDESVLEEAVGNFLTHEIIETVVAEENGELIGFFTALYSPYQWNPSRMCAEEQGVWVKEGAPLLTMRRLWRFVERRMKERGVSVIFAKTRAGGPESIKRIYNRFGMAPFQTYYTGEVR